jgi:hypothetical protein
MNKQFIRLDDGTNNLQYGVITIWDGHIYGYSCFSNIQQFHEYCNFLLDTGYSETYYQASIVHAVHLDSPQSKVLTDEQLKVLRDETIRLKSKIKNFDKY